MGLDLAEIEKEFCAEMVRLKESINRHNQLLQDMEECQRELSSMEAEAKNLIHCLQQHKERFENIYKVIFWVFTLMNGRLQRHQEEVKEVILAATIKPQHKRRAIYNAIKALWPGNRQGKKTVFF